MQALSKHFDVDRLTDAAGQPDGGLTTFLWPSPSLTTSAFWMANSPPTELIPEGSGDSDDSEGY
jgi:hypothetical protein